jgi:hypothetical protein
MSVQGYLGQGNQSLQDSTDPTLKDYTHASKTFISNGYQYSPRLKFLFHVYFNINTANIPQLQAAYGSGAIATLSLLVKSAELPKFKIDTTVLNQYNRKRVVQTKMRYEPSRIIFHDDQADLIRNMWYNYYSYYYGDPSHQYAGISNMSGTMGRLMTQANAFNYNTSDIYSQQQASANWGFQGETYHDGTNLLFSGLGGKPAFFRDITIYGLSQKKFAQWTLINPIITGWRGDNYDYSESGSTMQNEMSFEYESVKYFMGNIGSNQPSDSVSGFADPAHYDTTSSSITTEQGRQTVYTNSGVVSAVSGTVQDLNNTNAGLSGLQNVLGGVQTAGTLLNVLSGSALSQQLGVGQLINGGLNSLAGESTNMLGTLAGKLNSLATTAKGGTIIPTAPTPPSATPGF